MLREPATHPDTALYTEHGSGLPLIAGFFSYRSVDAVIAELSAQGATPQRRTLARPPSSDYPTHVLDTLSVDAYALLGTQGRLTLEFFNDRLYEVDFKPQDAKACATALRKLDPQLRRDRNGRSEHVDGERRVVTNVDLAFSSVGQSLGTEPYVLWQDKRLVQQRDDWDRRFGAIPYSVK